MIKAAIVTACVVACVGLAAVIESVTATSRHGQTAEAGLPTANGSDVMTAPNTSFVTSADTLHTHDQHGITTLSPFNAG